MKKFFSLFILMLVAEQFCFATITNSSDTIKIVKKECKASIIDGKNSSTFSLTYFEFDSLPIPLRDSVKKIFEKRMKEISNSEDTAFDIKQIAANFISMFQIADFAKQNDFVNNYTGTFSIIAETIHHLSIKYSDLKEGPLYGIHYYSDVNEYFLLDKSTGKKVNLEKIIEPNKLNKFKKLDFNIFKNNVGGDSFLQISAEYLYSFLYSTCYIDNDGFHKLFEGWDTGFHYFTEYLIPMNELKPLLRKNFEW